MDYKITCICGHPFIVSEENLRAAQGGTITCPACHQRLSPAIEAPVPKPPDTPSAATAAGTTIAGGAPAPAAAEAEPTKRCPFCGEVILAIARKCKHCGEFLDRPATAPTGRAPLNPRTPSTGDAEEPAFSLSISQWDNFWRFLSIATLFAAAVAALLKIKALSPYAPAGLPCALALAVLAVVYYYTRARSTRITIRPFSLEVEMGIFNKHLTSLELFRVTDIALQQGLIPRILGFGTIKLTTTDADSPELILFQIPRARAVRSYLQTQVPLAARQRGAFYVEK